MVDTEPTPEASSIELPQITPHPPQSEHNSPSHAINDQAILAPSAGTTVASPPLYPPIPAYSPARASLHENNRAAIATLPSFPPQAADADVVRYNMAHNGAGGVHRLPEVFPGYAHSLRSSIGPPESLPPYNANNPPRYTRYNPAQMEEPQAMAQLFFKFGFFFPAFWIFGALMLITPLRDPSPLNQHSVWPPTSDYSTWCNQHLETDEEREEFMRKFQAAEMKWAKRCLLASFMLVCFAIAIGATVFGVIRTTSKSKD